MKKYIISSLAAIALVLSVVTPARAEGPVTIAELQAKIAQLTAQLSAISGGQTGTFDSGATSGQITRDLNVGSQGVDVVTLQNFLIQKGFLTIPNGLAKGYFGSLTKAAVAAYQTSVGSEATGFVGPTTRAGINKRFYGIDGGGDVSTRPNTSSPSITFLYPKGGEVLGVDDKIEVKYSVNNLSDKTTLYLYSPIYGNVYSTEINAIGTGKDSTVINPAKQAGSYKYGTYKVGICNEGNVNPQATFKPLCVWSNEFTVAANATSSSDLFITSVSSKANANFEIDLNSQAYIGVKGIGTDASAIKVYVGGMPSSVKQASGEYVYIDTPTDGIVVGSTYDLYLTKGTQKSNTVRVKVISKGVTPPTNPSITVLSPNGGETWAKGTQQYITWKPMNGLFTIYLMPGIRTPKLPPNSGAYIMPPAPYSPVMIAQSVDGSSGRYLWNVAPSVLAGHEYLDGTYYIRICSKDGVVCDNSDTDFTIASKPSTDTSVTGSAKFVPNTLDVVGIWDVFKAGAGASGKTADWRWDLNLNNKGTSKTIKRISVFHESTGEGWSSDYELMYERANGYPLLVQPEKGGDPLTTVYTPNLNYTLANGGSTYIMLFGQPEGGTFNGGTIKVLFTDGTNLSVPILNTTSPVSAPTSSSPVITAVTTAMNDNANANFGIDLNSSAYIGVKGIGTDASDIKVYVGGIQASVKQANGDYIYIKTPTDGLAVGSTYDLYLTKGTQKSNTVRVKVLSKDATTQPFIKSVSSKANLDSEIWIDTESFLSGGNFLCNGSEYVYINGSSATIKSCSINSIYFVAPKGLSIGSKYDLYVKNVQGVSNIVKVKVAGQKVSTVIPLNSPLEKTTITLSNGSKQTFYESFNASSSIPRIDSINKTGAVVGNTIIITGKNFSTTGDNMVYISNLKGGVWQVNAKAIAAQGGVQSINFTIGNWQSGQYYVYVTNGNGQSNYKGLYITTTGSGANSLDAIKAALDEIQRILNNQ